MNLQCYAHKQAVGVVSQELLDTQVNPAVWEISGHMVLKRRNDFDNASEDYACRLLAEVSVSQVRFEEIKFFVLEAAGLHEEVRLVGSNHKEDLCEPATPQVESHIPQDCLVSSAVKY